MADNYVLRDGAGTLLAADDVLGTLVPRVKIQAGEDGEAEDVSTANPLPVRVESWVPSSLTVSGEVDIGSLPDVTLGAALPAGTNAIGTVEVTSLPALPTGSNAIGKVQVTSLPNVTIGAALPAGSNALGSVTLGAALPTGTNTIGKVEVTSIATGSNVIGAVQIRPSLTSALFVYKGFVGGTGTLIRSSACVVFGWHFINTDSADAFIKLYNLSSAPSVGTSTAIVTVFVPAGGSTTATFTHGIDLTTGLGIGCTRGVEDDNTTSVTATTILANLFYKY